ncbi:MAG: methyl-accepting chemotaxis protein [Rhizobium sp.]|nr:methyl-accepting chemotaxis protein [Rhizobium sp.]MCZ8351549.1 methyl-accepting chemotaxis protein [Rhizobium sp.]
MNITISRSLMLFGAFVALGFGVALGVFYYSFDRLKVNGPVSNELHLGQDFIADILPPPLFLMEPFLIALETTSGAENPEQNIRRIIVARQAYAKSMRRWEFSGLPPEILNGLRNRIKPSADTFWTEMNEVFIPAVKSKNKIVMSRSLKRLKGTYETQRQAILDITKLSEDYMADREAKALATAGNLTLFTAAMSGSAFILLVAGLYVFRRRAVLPLAQFGTYMNRLAEGDYDTPVPYADRKDEIGAMAGAVAVFREAGLEKIRIEDEARKQQAQLEEERSARLASQIAQAENLQRVISDLGAGLDRLSKFNIRYTLDVPFQPEFEQLRHDFNKSLAVFQETMSQVLDKARQIESNAGALQQSSDQLAKRTEQQAAALEETAAALQEVTNNIRTSASRTSSTREKTRDARQSVEKSTRVVQDAVEAMRRIEEASSSIASITDVIDQIAFQTNLLALNAGVEAARAGEAGKGFAVVAQEVRDLAQRSAAAAKQINGLIEQSGREVAGGVSLVRDTGSALGEIATSISSIALDVEAIANAAQEQASGLAEISQAVNQMDQLTQQNAGMVEETSAATHSLSEEVSELVRLVGQFVFNRRSRVRDTPEDAERTLAMRGRTGGAKELAA